MCSTVAYLTPLLSCAVRNCLDITESPTGWAAHDQAILYMLTNGPSMVLTEVCWRRNKTGNLGAQALDARMRLARESLKEIWGKMGISLVSTFDVSELEGQSFTLPTVLIRKTGVVGT